MSILKARKFSLGDSPGSAAGAILALTAFFGAAPDNLALALDAERPSLGIELNRLQDKGSACRLSLVFTNGMVEAISALTIETVLFDKNGSVERFLVLKSRPLPPGKIRVQQFDVRGVKCDSIGKLLLNDVKECKSGSLDAASCLELIRPSSRTGIPFISTAMPSGTN